MSYSLLCSSALSNEERKNIVRKFKSNQRKREIYNKYNDHYLQLEPAKKKQRYSLMDRAKKDELLEACAKKYKEIDVSKKKQILENRRKKYKEMDASQKKQMLNRKAVKSRKSYDSMDCEKKEKYLNAIRNQSAIPRKVPCQAVYNDMIVDDIPTELSTLEKGQQRKIKGAICNVPVECDKTCQTLPRAPESSGIILLKLKRKLQFRGHVYYQAVHPEIALNALNWLKANNELYKTITRDIEK